MTLVILRYTYFCTDYFKHCKKISKHIDSIVTIEFIIRTVKNKISVIFLEIITNKKVYLKNVLRLS